MSRRRNEWPCFLCDKLHAELEDAEACERRHGLEHDAWCQCEQCRWERAIDTALEHQYD